LALAILDFGGGGIAPKYSPLKPPLVKLLCYTVKHLSLNQSATFSVTAAKCSVRQISLDMHTCQYHPSYRNNESVYCRLWTLQVVSSTRSSTCHCHPVVPNPSHQAYSAEAAYSVTGPKCALTGRLLVGCCTIASDVGGSNSGDFNLLVNKMPSCTVQIISISCTIIHYNKKAFEN